MNLESLVTNLELSKIIKSLGVKQDSFLYWSNKYDGGKTWRLWVNMHNPKSSIDNGELDPDMISAYTSGELGMMLPEECVSFKHGRGWMCAAPNQKLNVPGQPATTEANSRALMLIYCIENGIIKI
jgi:hypothetical protein